MIFSGRSGEQPALAMLPYLAESQASKAGVSSPSSICGRFMAHSPGRPTSIPVDWDFPFDLDRS
jgi:hypothetical protein